VKVDIKCGIKRESGYETRNGANGGDIVIFEIIQAWNRLIGRGGT